MKKNVMKRKVSVVMGVLCFLAPMQLWASQAEYDLRKNGGRDEGKIAHEVQKEYVDYVTGHEKRLIELKVTPEEHVFLPGYCEGHRNGASYEMTYCGACENDGYAVLKPKRVEIIRDIWVGCEDLAYAVSMGYAEVRDEQLMSRNETRLLFGEPVTRDAWERMRTYALTKEGSYIYHTKQY